MGTRERDGGNRTGVVESVASHLRKRFVRRRRTLRRRLASVGRDALVVLVLLALVVVVVGAAASILGVAVSNGGVLGVVLGWTAAFAFAVSLPVLAMKVAVAVYERVGG